MSQKLTKYLTPVVALFFATALGVTASSTIGTDITTGGDLTVDGTVIFSSADSLQLPVSVGSGSGTTFDTGGDGTNWTFTASGGGDIILNPSAGGETKLQGRVRFNPFGSGPEPVACGAGSEGTVGYSLVEQELCVCNGTAYVLVSDAVTACTFNAS